MLCRDEERDPRPCLDAGKAVTACAMDVLKKMKRHCYEDFNAYMYCLERSSGTLELSPYVTLKSYCVDSSPDISYQLQQYDYGDRVTM